jgi:hypothetical protein
MAAWAGMARHYQGGNYHSGSYSYTPQPYWRRYIAILEKDSQRVFAKVIIQEDLKPWAEKQGYEVVRSSQLYGTINPEKEKTEFSR